MSEPLTDTRPRCPFCDSAKVDWGRDPGEHARCRDCGQLWRKDAVDKLVCKGCGVLLSDPALHIAGCWPPVEPAKEKP